MKSQLQTAAESLFATLFPADCKLCERPLPNVSRLPVCPDCLLRVQPFTQRQCLTCGELLISRGLPSALGEPNPTFFEAEDAALCGLCQRVKPSFERATAYGPYEGALRDLIHLLKYERVRTAAPILGGYLAEAIMQFAEEVAADCPLVIPVPLFAARQRERGFNQTLLVTQAALKLLPFAVELRPELLERRKPTSSQTGLTRHQRRENVRGAFVVKRKVGTMKERTVILLDDVLTTGTTVEECARVCKRAGAEKVWVATIARVTRLEATLGFQDVQLSPEALKNAAQA